MRQSLFPFAFIVYVTLVLFSPPAEGEAETTHEYLQTRQEISKTLAGEKNMVGHIRVSGMLCDLLRVQKERFETAGSTGSNDIAIKAEDLLNEAGMASSQEDFVASYAILDEATELIIGSLDGVTGEPTSAP